MAALSNVSIQRELLERYPSRVIPYGALTLFAKERRVDYQRVRNVSGKLGFRVMSRPEQILTCMNGTPKNAREVAAEAGLGVAVARQTLREMESRGLVVVVQRAARGDNRNSTLYVRP